VFADKPGTSLLGLFDSQKTFEKTALSLVNLLTSHLYYHANAMIMNMPWMEEWTRLKRPWREASGVR
jgi:hypothetical protein